MKTITNTLTIILGALLLGASAAAIALPQEKKQSMNSVSPVKGKLPVGWSTGLSLGTKQKEKMYAVSQTFQQKIAEIKEQEYQALYQLLSPEQKAILKSKILD